MQNFCSFCGKKFSRKIIYKRHIILCEILNNPKTKREIECEKEEIICTPSMEQLYNIILELAFKCSKLEEKVVELQKSGGHVKKIAPVNVLEIVNKTIIPTQYFHEWIKTINLHVTDEDIDYLMEPQSVHDILIKIIYREIESGYNLANLNEYPYPFLCVKQQQKSFYIYTIEEEWEICPLDQFLYFIKAVHSKVFNAMCTWNTNHSKQLDSSDKLEDAYNTALMKVTGYKFSESDINKIRNNIYQHMKIDL